MLDNDIREKNLASLESLRLTLELSDGERKEVIGRFDCCRVNPENYPDDYNLYSIRSSDDDDADMNIIGLSYNFKF